MHCIVYFSIRTISHNSDTFDVPIRQWFSTNINLAIYDQQRSLQKSLINPKEINKSHQ